MMSQHDLGRAFENGAKRGRASNVRIVELCGGWTALVGYQWAAYAVRTNDGTIHYYKGWYGYSPSTSCQLSRMGMESMADRTHDSAARLSEFNVSALADLPDPVEAGTESNPRRRGRRRW